MAFLLIVQRVGKQFVVVHGRQFRLVLGVVDVELCVRAVDDVVALCRGMRNGVGLPCAPPHERGSLRESAFDDFVPSNHLPSVLVDVFLHVLDEPRLQFFLVFETVVFDALLAVGTLLPVVLLHLVATDVHIFIGEELEHFVPHVATEPEHAVLSRAEWGSEDLSPADLLEARQSVVVADGSQHVPGHVDFGHSLDASLAGISNDFADVVLRIVAAVERIAVLYALLGIGQEHVVGILSDGTAQTDRVLIVVGAPCSALGEQRIFLDFNAPSLVVGEVPVEAVELIERHEVDDFLDLVLREEVAGAVEMETAPSEARTVGDGDAGNCLAVNQLAERGNAAHNAVIVGAVDGDAVLLHRQFVIIVAVPSRRDDDVRLFALHDFQRQSGHLSDGSLQILRSQSPVGEVAMTDGGRFSDGELALLPRDLVGNGHYVARGMQWEQACKCNQ